MMGNHRVTFVVAMDNARGIGKKGTLPWRLPKELAHFHRITTETREPMKQNMVIMGRTTWESIPEHHRPLPKRKNVILSHRKDFSASGGFVAASLDEAFALADDSIETLHIIGGGRVFTETLHHPALDDIYLTKVDASFDCDTFFPEIPKTFSKKETLGADCENGLCYTMYRYSKVSGLPAVAGLNG